MASGAASGSIVPAHARSFGKYTLVLKLATGGMAEIFLAQLRGVAGFEKLVVIKRILPHLADEPQFVSMFLDEARIAAHISHPNVCQVYELGEVDGQYFLAMEYLEGVTLNAAMRKLSRERRLADVRLVAGVIGQACEGLHHAHELADAAGEPLNLVHRDVSPQNLFLTIDGVTKLLDFGIAKAAGASSKTRTGTVKGKYAYMPPEQLRGDAVDRRVDVWALGVVLFEALTGKRLFWRETDFLIFRAITEEPIPRVRDYRPDVSPALDTVVARALSREREARFPTARALGSALAEALANAGGPLTQVSVGAEVKALFAQEVMSQRELVMRAIGEDEPDTLPGTLEPITITPTPPAPPTTPTGQIASARLPLPPPPHDTGEEAAIVSPEPPLPMPLAVGAAGSTPVRAASAPGVLAGGSGGALPSLGPEQETVRHDEVAPLTTGAVPEAALLRADSRRRRWMGVLGGLSLAAVAAIFFLVAARDNTGEPPASTAAALPARPAIDPPRDPQPALPPPADAAVQAVKPPPPEPPPPPVEVTPDAAAAAPPADPPVDDPPEDPVAKDPPKPPVKPPPRKPPPPPKERDPPKPPKETKEPKDTTPGFITIDSEPYATIYVDGKKMGVTPLVRMSLPPGTHKVRAVSAAGEKTFTVTIEPGKEAKGRRLTW